MENSTVRIIGIISLYWWFLVVNNGGLEHNIYTFISNFNYSWLITYVSIVQMVELCTKTHHIIYITWLAHVFICQLSSLFFNYQFPPYYFVVVKVDKYWISIFNCSSKYISSKAFLRLVVVRWWPIYPYPSGWLHWVLDNHTHDDVIKWKQFPRYWPFGRGIQRSPVNSSHKSQWRGALRFSLICAWINRWANNGVAGDFRRYCAHYDVIVMDCEATMELMGKHIMWMCKEH